MAAPPLEALSAPSKLERGPLFRFSPVTAAAELATAALDGSAALAVGEGGPLRVTGLGDVTLLLAWSWPLQLRVQALGEPGLASCCCWSCAADALRVTGREVASVSSKNSHVMEMSLACKFIVLTICMSMPRHRGYV